MSPPQPFPNPKEKLLRPPSHPLKPSLYQCHQIDTVGEFAVKKVMKMATMRKLNQNERYWQLNFHLSAQPSF